MLDLLPLATFSLVGAWLSLIDIRTHLLPNRIVLQLTAVLTVLMLMLTAFTGQWGHFGQALARAVGYLAIYLLVYLVSRGQLGFGDVKFSVSCGLTIGWYSPGDWLLAIWITFLLAGLISITGLLLRKLKLRDAIAFGPYMFGAVVMVSGFRILVGGASG